MKILKLNKTFCNRPPGGGWGKTQRFHTDSKGIYQQFIIGRFFIKTKPKLVQTELLFLPKLTFEINRDHGNQQQVGNAEGGCSMPVYA